MSLSTAPRTPSPPSVASPAKPMPLFEIATQWQLIRNDVEAAVKEVFESQQFTSSGTSGPFIGRFEENLGKAALKLPAGTQTGRIFELKDKGIPRLRGGGRGDQIVRVRVVTPTALNNDQKRIFKELNRPQDSV